MTRSSTLMLSRVGDLEKAKQRHVGVERSA
jgi:hypothetical protein